MDARHRPKIGPLMEKHYFVKGGGLDPKACLKCGRSEAHDIHLVPQRTVSVPLKP